MTREDRKDCGEISREDVFLVLGAIQDAEGRIPRGALDEVAQRSGIPIARLYGAVTADPALKIEED